MGSIAGMRQEDITPQRLSAEVRRLVERDDPEETRQRLVRAGYRLNWGVLTRGTVRAHAEPIVNRWVGSPPPGCRIFSISHLGSLDIPSAPAELNVFVTPCDRTGLGNSLIPPK